MTKLYYGTLVLHIVLAAITVYMRFFHADTEVKVTFGGDPAFEAVKTEYEEFIKTANATTELRPEFVMYQVALELMRVSTFQALLETLLGVTALFVTAYSSRILMTKLMIVTTLVLHGGELFVALDPLSQAENITSHTTTLVTILTIPTVLITGLYIIVLYYLTNAPAATTPTTTTTSTTTKKRN